MSIKTASWRCGCRVLWKRSTPRRRMEQGEIDAWRRSIGSSSRRLNVRADRRVRWRSLWHRLTTIKSLAGRQTAHPGTGRANLH